MVKIHEKVMRADFAKSLKRLIIFAICVMLLGGGASVALLVPQIGQAATAIRQREQDGEEYRGDGEHDFLDNMTITPPVAGALITLGVTALCGSLSLFLFWILVAAWLYQAAVRSGMNGLVWLTVGLACNVFGAIVFVLVRSFVRIKCPSCGAFQPIKTQYCSKCGASMYEKCADCGEGCAVGDTFCRACGKPLHTNSN